MTTFSCITTSKNRQNHLAQSLPAMLSAGFDEVIVVDFDCPAATADWCRKTYPEVKVVEVANQTFFSAAKARNSGAEIASSKWLCFIDADVVLSRDFGPWLRRNARQNSFYAVNYSDQPREKRRLVKGAAGLLICEQAAFRAVSGYDEIFSGWGYEDIDIQLKLRHAGQQGRVLPFELIDSLIVHDNDARLRHHQNKDKRKSNLQNKFYSSAKMVLVAALGLRSELPRSIREDLYRAVADAAEKWNPADLRSVQSVELGVPAGIQVLPEYKMQNSSLLRGAAPGKFVVKAAFEKRLRRDIFSRLPRLLRNLRTGLR